MFCEMYSARDCTETLPREHMITGLGNSKARRLDVNGAGTRSRTRDLLITSQLLYQLSYTGTEGPPLYPFVSLSKATFKARFFRRGYQQLSSYAQT